MLDSRTKRTLIENSPVTTQTPSWSLFRSTSNIPRILSTDRSFRGFIRLRSSIPTSRSVEIRHERTSLLSSYGNSSAFSRREFGSHRYSSNHRFGDSPFMIFYAETSLHRISLQGLDWKTGSSSLLLSNVIRLD